MANDVDKSSTEKYKQQFEYWDDVTDVARQNSRRDRDYRDGKQWTEQEAATLEQRGQAPIVINRIGPKVDFMIGVERSNRQDPKAWPRTPDHEDAAAAATDALRYVADNSELDQVFSDCFEDQLVEGVEGAITEWIDNEIVTTRIPFDRGYYDPHSTKRDFSDATYKGLFIWMDKDKAVQMFGEGKKEEIENSFVESVGMDAGTEDKPMWIDRKRKRVKVCQHYYLEDTWKVVYFSGDTILIEPKESPYLDENGKPMCPIDFRYAYLDREADRYGWVRQFIDIQDEINHRRSKALYILSRRQVIADRGAVDDINQARSELTKGDGVVEVTPGARFDVDPGSDLAQGQTILLQEAKAEIDQIANRSVVAPDASGRSRLMADSKDLIEVGPLFDTHRSFKKAVYRQIWLRVRQFWTEERWIRVTDNEDNLKFVGLNQPRTVGEVLQERAEQGDETAVQALQQLLSTQDARINQVAEVKNNVAELDVDITISEVMDAANVQQEQFEMLINLAQAYGPQAVPFETVVEMSQLRNKKELLDKLKGDPQQQQLNQQVQLQQLQMQIEQQRMQMAEIQSKIANMNADTRKKVAETEKTEQQAIQTAVETQVLTQQPVSNVSVNT